MKKTALLLLLLLAGCDPEKKVDEKPQEVDKGLYHLKEEAKPIERVVEEPIPSTPVQFPDVKPLEREAKAKVLRGLRQNAAFSKGPTVTKVKNYHLQDEDYQRGETKFPEDKSTLPVDRSRLLTTDMRIGAVLEDNLNSQIPGKVIALVDRDVLSPNGKFILLPAYTKIICHYEGLSKTGETRLNLQCDRVIRPDGLSIALTEASASDQMGRTGVIGEVDNRNFERFGGAFLISGISALAQSGVNLNQSPWVNNSANTLSNNLGQVTREVIKQNIDLRPIITIEAGTKIQIIPETDIAFIKPIEENHEHP